MSINLASLDARILKLQKTRQLLADPETQELLSDPEVIAAIREATIGAGPNRQDLTEKPSGARAAKLPPDRSAQGAVLEATAELADHFDARGVVGVMTRAGYRFAAKDANVAVNSALAKLVKRGLLRVVHKGTGRVPNLYTRAAQ